MKKIFFAAIPLIVLLFLLGCNQPPAASETAGLKDCGNSEQCINDAIKACDGAFGTLVQASDSPKSTVSTKIISFGFEAEKCKIKYVIEKIELDSSSEDAASMGLLAAMLQGKDMTCLVPKEKLANAEAVGPMAVVDDPTQLCTGSLVDTIKMMSGQS